MFEDTNSLDGAQMMEELQKDQKKSVFNFNIQSDKIFDVINESFSIVYRASFVYAAKTNDNA